MILANMVNIELSALVIDLRPKLPPPHGEFLGLFALAPNLGPPWSRLSDVSASNTAGSPRNETNQMSQILA
jgi:hypothetical protein